VVYEDESARVWRGALAPGEDSPVHSHELDHLLVQVRGDRISVIPEPDTKGPSTEVLEADVVAGVVVHLRRGDVPVAVLGSVTTVPPQSSRAKLSFVLTCEGEAGAP
jgi:predicted metal-dependent enzyme (double-stranded beta helix superfamily)